MNHAKMTNRPLSFLGFPLTDGRAVASLDLSNQYQLTDQLLNLVSESCPNLIELKLDNCSQLNQGSLIAIIKKCRQLKHLSLKGCPLVTDATLHAISSNLPHLSSLNLHGCFEITAEGIRVLAAGCNLIEKLDVSYCQCIDADSILTVLILCPRISQLTAKYLWRIEDSFDGVEELLEMNPTTFSALEKLDMSGCTSMGDHFLYQFAIRCPNLKNIDLSDCQQISDKGIASIAAHCPSLASYTLTDMPSLSDAGILDIAQHSKNLTEISLKRCSISDSGVGFLLQKCLKLVSLDVGGCHKLTAVTLKGLIGHSKFRHLDVSFCHKMVNENNVKELMSVSGQLESITLWGLSLKEDFIEDMRCLNPRVEIHSTHSKASHKRLKGSHSEP